MSQPNPNMSITERIELTLEQLGMTRDELRELIELILGLKKGAVSLEEGINVTDDDGIKPLDQALSDEEMLELLEKLEFLERLRLLELQGYTLDPLELEMLLQAGKDAQLDSKTLELIAYNEKREELRKILSMADIEALKGALTNMELSAAITEVITSSGDANVQATMLGELSAKHLPEGQHLELGDDNKLYVKHQQVIEQTTKDVQKTLIRLDYKMDLKRLYEDAKQYMAKLRQAMSGDANKQGHSAKHLDDVKAVLNQAPEKGLENEPLVETEKDQKKLKILDHVSDLKRFFKSVKNTIKGNAKMLFKPHEKWEHGNDGLKLNISEEEIIQPGGEEASDVIKRQSEADVATKKDQHDLKILDHQRDMLKNNLSKQNPATMAAQSAMKKADDLIRAQNLENTKDIAVTGDVSTSLKSGFEGVSGGKEADMNNLKDSLDQTKDFRSKLGREIT